MNALPISFFFSFFYLCGTVLFELQFQKRQVNHMTYIPSPSVRWMCLADINNKKICHISKVPNNLGKVVLETDEKRRSAAAAKVKNQRPIPFDEVQNSAFLSICGNQMAVWCGHTKSSCLL